ncbi:MAG: hypothetical protein AAFQ82_21845, partial [Myxococcota bacterium]
VGFDAYPTRVAVRVESRWQEAIDAGMDVGRIQLDWRDLEPKPNEFDEDELREQLRGLHTQGLRPLVGLYAVDSEGIVLPPDLQEEVSGGLRLDSPRVRNRHNALLDRVVPILEEFDAWGILLTNEPDAWVDDESRAADELAGFYRNARERIRERSELLAVSATHTIGILDTPERFHAAAIQELDFGSYNYYPLTAELFALELSVDAIKDTLQELVDASLGKDIILQELGAPSGLDGTSPMGASVALQRDFIERSLRACRDNDRVRAAFVFQLIDWTPRSIAALTPELEGEVPTDFLERFEEWFLTIGMLDRRGRPRPAWSVFLNALEQERAR